MIDDAMVGHRIQNYCVKRITQQIRKLELIFLFRICVFDFLPDLIFAVEENETKVRAGGYS